MRFLRHLPFATIAKRTLFLVGEHNRAVTVTIFRPRRDGRDYRCEFGIDGLGASRLYYAMGVDSAQALFLALKRVGTILYTSDAGKAGRLRWFGSSNLGFPVPDSIPDLPSTSVPSRPADDEVLVTDGEIYEQGRSLIATRVEELASESDMPFEVKSIQVSHSASYGLIVRAHVDWTMDGHAVGSLEMIWRDNDGNEGSSGDVIG